MKIKWTSRKNKLFTKTPLGKVWIVYNRLYKSYFLIDEANIKIQIKTVSEGKKIIDRIINNYLKYG